MCSCCMVVNFTCSRQQYKTADAMEKQDSVPLCTVVELWNIWFVLLLTMNTYFGLHVMGLKMLDFNQIWSLSINFCQRSQYQISRKSVQWESRCGQTDRHNEANRRFSLFMRTCLQRRPFVRQWTSVYTATDEGQYVSLKFWRILGLNVTQLPSKHVA